MMQLSKKVPFEDPQVLMMVRGCYILSNLLILAIHLYTQFKINQKKGMPDRVLSPPSKNTQKLTDIRRHDDPQVR
jgi:hypothetical protein